MPEARPRLLIVDDDTNLLGAMSRALSPDFQVLTADGVTTARAAFGDAIDVVLLDMRLEMAESSADGVELLKEFKSSNPATPVIMISAFGDIETAVECMKIGAADFIKKPANIRELRERLRRAVEVARVSRRATQLEERLRDLDPSDFVGESAEILEVKRLAGMVATDGHATVLITGETGTGKELVARSIHQSGWRSTAPFVPVAVSCFNPSLVESELFGHEPGAFTGASERRIGFIERADGGVLFLDEVGDLTEAVQLKLLRFLEERTIVRAGSSREIRVDVQVVAATNRDLEMALGEGRIRKDFYYRLKSVQITLPPLRARVADVPVLAGHFLNLLRRQGRTRVEDVSKAAVDALCRYQWPGNVRELRAVVERAVIYANQRGHGSIEVDDLPLEIQRDLGGPPNLGGSHVTSGASLDEELARVEMGRIEDALKAAAGRKAQASASLGLNDRFALRRRVQALFRRYPGLRGEFPVASRLFPNQ